MNELAVPSFDNNLGPIRSLAIKGINEVVVYAAHEQLEESLAKIPILLADTKKFGNSDSVDPWEGVVAIIHALCSQVTLCLQIFKTGVKIEHSKGLRTVADLYIKHTDIAKRLREFFLVIQAPFMGIHSCVPIPGIITQRFAESIRLHDAKQAVEWLQLGLDNFIELHRMVNVETDSKKELPHPEIARLFRIVISGTDEMGEGKLSVIKNNNILISMATLLIKCNAEIDHSGTKRSAHLAQLESILNKSEMESLLRFEDVCALLMKEKQLRIEKMAERRRARDGSVAQSSSTITRIEATHDSSSTESTHMSFLKRYIGPLLAVDPPFGSRTRIVMFIAAFLLLCVITRRMFTVTNAGLKGLKGSLYKGKKALTL